ncbi:unnamed protein product, partial [Mesorhabditis belari]|uniref:Uncharacterized protein n=1 Tax=Mesorhabditis belari TaxID=2138241 RepID=A0AAF3J8Y4_9BILA
MTSNAPLEFEVVPEIGLKHSTIHFILGTPLNDVMALLQQNSRLIPNVDFLYSKKNPFFDDIQIRLVKSGINLFFDGRTQLLKLLEVDALSSIVLKYNGKIFSEPSAEATMERVGTFFASTHPGAYDERQKMYVQSWRGLSFCFPTTNSSNVEITPGFSPSLHSLRYDASSQPKLTKMSIFKGTIGGNKEEDELIVPLASYCGQNRTILADVLVDMGRVVGCSFNFLTQNGEAAPDRTSQADLELIEVTREIRFGDSSASVMCALGAPSRVFYKSEDKMIIHRSVGKDGRNEPDFFFNYFSMGVIFTLSLL